MANPDPDIQKNTGYSQYDFLQKLIFSPSNKFDIIANIQYSTSSDIDRYDKLNDYNGDNLKYAEYYYGPQNRLFTSLKTVIKNTTSYLLILLQHWLIKRLRKTG